MTLTLTLTPPPLTPPPHPWLDAPLTPGKTPPPDPGGATPRVLGRQLPPPPPPRGLRPTVSCQRYEPKEPTGAEGAPAPKAPNGVM